MKAQVKKEKKKEEVSAEEEEIIAPERLKVTMSPEAIESRYQAHLEKIQAGGK